MEPTKEAPIIMLHVGLDLSRKRLDFDLLCEDGSRLERGAGRRMRMGCAGWRAVWGCSASR